MKATTILAAGILLASTIPGFAFLTSESSYLLAAPGADFTFEPILTVGDRVPTTGGTPTAEFALCGIPDAMGIYRDTITGERILFCAHEIPSGVLSEPFPGATKYLGAWVTRLVLNADNSVASGTVAHKDLFLENVFQANTSPLQGASTSFTRFCSGAFAGREHGLDRPFFFTNEESSSGNYNANGSQTVAITGGKMYTLPRLGRVVRETTIVQPRRDSKTVIISTEDGNNPSFVFMYVGTKVFTSSSPLDRNGLTNGKTYVLCGRDAHHNEGTFTTGTLPVKWKEVPNAHTLNATALNTAADALGGFGFVRVEDAEFDPTQPTRSCFLATTGGSASNKLGRLYELTMNPSNPLLNGTLNVVYNADLIVTPGGNFGAAATGTLLAANGGNIARLGDYTGGVIANGVDYPVSVDNIAVSKDFVVIQEDRNSPADAVFANYARNGGLWTLDRNNNYAAKLQSTFNYAYTESRDGNAAASTTAGRWESSGVIASDAIFGAGTFIVNVQAHAQSAAYHRSNISKPGGGTYTKAEAAQLFVEDGQILIMKPTP